MIESDSVTFAALSTKIMINLKNIWDFASSTLLMIQITILTTVKTYSYKILISVQNCLNCSALRFSWLYQWYASQKLHQQDFFLLQKCWMI